MRNSFTKRKPTLTQSTSYDFSSNNSFKIISSPSSIKSQNTPKSTIRPRHNKSKVS